MDTPNDWLPAELRGRPLERPFYEGLTESESQALRDTQATAAQDASLDFDLLDGG